MVCVFVWCVFFLVLSFFLVFCLLFLVVLLVLMVCVFVWCVFFGFEFFFDGVFVFFVCLWF